jgi:hypothetical protein
VLSTPTLNSTTGHSWILVFQWDVKQLKVIKLNPYLPLLSHKKELMFSTMLLKDKESS